MGCWDLTPVLWVTELSSSPGCKCTWGVCHCLAVSEGVPAAGQEEATSLCTFRVEWQTLLFKSPLWNLVLC